VIFAGRKSQKEPEIAHAALAEFCQTYWAPLYSFVRSRGCTVRADCRSEAKEKLFNELRIFLAECAGPQPAYGSHASEHVIVKFCALKSANREVRNKSG